MKAIPFKVSRSTNSVKIEYDKFTSFYPHFHFHQEIQITLIQQGFGTVIIGDRILNFNEGKILMIGSCVPHKFIANSDSTFQKAFSIYFEPLIFGKQFWQLPEFIQYKSLIENSKSGILFDNKPKIARKIQSMYFDKDYNKGILLLEILDCLYKSQNYELLSTIRFSKEPLIYNGQRMEKVISYTDQKFKDQIRLDDVANIANLTCSSFCREFKRYTRRTYFNYLNETRIKHVCKLLMLGKNIDISWQQSGFQNQANFNRQFRRFKGMTPSEYLRKIKI